ncbi:EAL domain-containing protein [Bacillus safensis]|uniref:bifunctional diguanylate cyclase/phosphodiesterase n=1 Tax=Bacillus safensis TaxID=561879 RepID=UPI0022370F48|nr:EAL domain-containing protein [Bacillus safensis]MCW4643352.1 EAL domain-containing protein [Bacillus safensis]MCY7565363.1 EAL domain-containing protein [Bacillus safensis]MCY7627411.1 EAL domain-containing protein [Bacillus safensis]MCY7647708.1 EAL domain-containing protein [Bacillus safensis]MCY7653797.1 EAL domain-containing protein [Bacillus safensis]
MTHLTGSYNGWLVFLSIAVAAVASYSALHIASRVAQSSGAKKKVWLLIGAMIMGMGIWSMHFIGMMAFQMRFGITYDTSLLILSILASFIGSLIAFSICIQKQLSTRRLLISSITMGTAICSMHYLGMESMANVSISYDPVLFFLSFFIAAIASYFSLKLFFRVEHIKSKQKNYLLKSLGSMLMGGAIAGMHYTSMAASTMFYHSNGQAAAGGFLEMSPFSLSIFIGLMTLIVQTLMIFGAYIDHRIMTQSDQLKENEQRFQSLIKHNIDGIIVLSVDRKVLSANDSGKQILELCNSKIGDDLSQYVMPTELWEEFISQSKKAITREAELKAADRFYYYHVTYIPVHVNNSLDSIYLVLKDLTQQRIAEKEIHVMAHYDALTELPNRRHGINHLNDVLSAQEKSKTSTAVLFLDLNRFKIINDALGHNIGDLLLKNAANRLTQCLPDNGFIARLGGDEFLMIFPHMDHDTHKIEQFSKNIIHQFERPFFIQNHQLITSISIGIAISPQNGKDGMELMRKADMAMYLSKKHKQSRYEFFTESMERLSEDRLNRELELRDAIQREQFVLHYQPQVSAKTRKMTGVEALLRMKAPDGSLKSPEAFIELAEESGLIIDIGRWVIDTAGKQAKMWYDAGLKIPVAVNLSAKQFNSEDLIDLIKLTLKKYDLKPSLLELEVTESMTMDNIKQSKQVLTSLKQLGVRISIDDFGTGHSSLSYLKDLPIHRLKIDKSFIEDILSDSKSEQITGAIIAMGHQLSLEVIAEGVETFAQAQLLSAQGCDDLQGFYYAKPLPASDIEKFISYPALLDT